VIEVKLPELVKRAGGAARFAWDKFFFAEQHDPRTQKAQEREVRRFVGWAEGQGSIWR
jgi:integrase/recombinase XerD